MAVGRKPDFMPLLAPGRHHMRLQDVHDRFVRGIRNEARREKLFLGLEELVQRLLRLKIPCELWIDGSFLTEKQNPSDIDVMVFVESSVNEALSAEQDIELYNINVGDAPPDVDVQVYTVYNIGHEFYGTPIEVGHEWGKGYGLENSELWLKGIAVLRLMENNVGLRLCS